MKRFEEEGGPIARMLNDTRYMSKVAKEYLSFICNPNSVYVIPGQLTGILRNVWGLDFYKDKENPDSYRADHRHHTVDAFVIGCTTRSMLQMAAKASDWADKAGGQYAGRKKLFKGKFLPYDNFDDDERIEFGNLLDKVVVSYKPDHKDVKNAKKIHSTIGQLHMDTAYGPTDIKAEKKGCIVVSLRVNITELEEKDLESVADKQLAKELKKIVKISDKEKRKDALLKYGQKNKINKVKCLLEKDEDNLVPIYKKDKNGNKEEKPYKYYVGGNNYCMDIYCLRPDDKRDPKNAGKWKWEVISNFDANQNGFEPKWRKEYPTAKRVMRLFINDLIILSFNRSEKEENIPVNIRKYIKKVLDASKEKEVNIVFRVKKISSNGQFFIRPHSIAKEKADTLSWGAMTSGIFERKCRKIYINEIGEFKDPGFNSGW